MGTSLSRALALFVGLFLVVGLSAAQSRWVLSAGAWASGALGGALTVYAVTGSRWWGWPSAMALACGLGRDIWAVAHAPFVAGTSISASAVMLLLPLGMACAPRVRRPRLAIAFFGCALAVAFPLLHVWSFGSSNYARTADRIVVFGARCYADGAPSLTLEDRVKTACALYHEGYAPRLRMSGGPGDGAVHETAAMARLARALGVPAHAIEIDETGHNTWATVDATPSGKTLVVSHFYHLARIKLSYRARGRDVFTVPARETRPVRGTPQFVAREVPAFWWYWLRAAIA